jgi:hypothetical protein
MSWISVIASFKEVFFSCRRLDNISILLVTLTTQNKVTIKVLFVTALMSDEACDLASGSSHLLIAISVLTIGT